jgi:hypothetical protein
MNMDHDHPNASISIMRFLMGFLLALSLFLFELGVSQIVLADDTHCKEVLKSGRLVSNPENECLSEGIYYFLVTLSRGPFASVRSNVEAPVAWILTGVIYGVMGGIVATFIRRFAVGIFLGIHVMGLVIMTLMAYLSNYIV